ncbi:hypothetical protein [Rhizobium grahamii]|uniref:Uncharacterized protein n=1 Tax=Rhizobium grahamii CCGE 502 TaxID=990285 RepID=S3HA39_9HYPH|nr:hypothetical protein [Rhizobium grahamii]EPE95697.1 hypothetical protein RGCCGE502_22645 [Rhizobium grahamii CCGE 502]
MPDFITGPVGKVLGGALLLAALYGGFRLWLHNHDAAILSGYVLLSEKTAAEAKVTEMERQRNAASQSLDELLKRAAADDIVEHQKQATLEQDLKANELLLSEKNRSCAADVGDVDFINRH